MLKLKQHPTSQYGNSILAVIDCDIDKCMLLRHHNDVIERELYIKSHRRSKYFSVATEKLSVAAKVSLLQLLLVFFFFSMLM